jgi:hypothetical protein
MQLAKAAVDRGKVLRSRLQIPIPELNPSPQVKLTAAGPVLVRLKKSGPVNLAVESVPTAPTGDLPRFLVI